METNAPTVIAAVPDWRVLLASEVARHPRGRAGVAIRLGVSRTYVSRALSDGKSGFEVVPQQFIARVIDRLHVIRECPATMQPQPRAECQRIGNGPAPTHNPLSMRIWRECQQCPHKPSSAAPTQKHNPQE